MIKVPSTCRFMTITFSTEIQEMKVYTALLKQQLKNVEDGEQAVSIYWLLRRCIKNRNVSSLVFIWAE